MVRVKICGVTTPDDALRAVDCGADAIGVNFHPASPRAVTLDEALAIRLVLPPFVHLVGVFVNQPAREVQRIAAGSMLDYAQLHGDETPQYLLQLNVNLIRAVRIRSDADLPKLRDWQGTPILLDGAGRPGSFGGETFDWSLVERARPFISGPLMVAGGLTPQNVGECILATRPVAVDVASGVEDAPRRKSPAKMRAFVRAVREAADALYDEMERRKA